MLERIGIDQISERDIFVLDLAGPETFPSDIGLSSPRFVCVVAWDARGASAAIIGRIGRKLLDSGAVYIASWGPDCERVHDIIDKEFAMWPGRKPEGVVMTTWHDDEPLADVIEFSLPGFRPDDEYSEGCGSLVGIAIGEPRWAAEMRAAYAEPRAHLERVSQTDPDNAV